MKQDQQPTPSSYTEALEVLGRLNVRKIANNTYLERTAANTIVVRLHASDIVTFFSDGTTELDTDSFCTALTLERINRYLPEGAEVAIRDGRWRYYSANLATLVRLFVDGMTIDSVSGRVMTNLKLTERD